MGTAALLTLVLLSQTVNASAKAPATAPIVPVEEMTKEAPTPRAKAVDDVEHAQRAAEFKANLQKQVEKKHAARTDKSKHQRNPNLRNPLPQITPVNNGGFPMGGDPFQIAQQQQLGNQWQAMQLAAQLQTQQVLLGAQYVGLRGGFVSGATSTTPVRAESTVSASPGLRGMVNPTSPAFVPNYGYFPGQLGTVSVPISQGIPGPHAGMMQSNGGIGSMSGVMNMTNGALGLPGNFSAHGGGSTQAHGAGHH